MSNYARIAVILEAAGDVVKEAEYDLHTMNRSAALIKGDYLLRLENALKAFLENPPESQ